MAGNSRILTKSYYFEVILSMIAIVIFVVAIYPYLNNLTIARNTTRRADVYVMSMSLESYFINHKGTVLSMLPSTPTEICKTNALSCNGFFDASFLTKHGEYIDHMPEDPLNPDDNNGTGYFIVLTPEKRIKVYAPETERGEKIGISTHSFEE